MTTQLGDLLDEARRRTFVGRRHELDSFDDALGGRSSRRVLLVHGPGGIGKTTLLLEFRTRARDAGRPVVLLDGREIDPAPEGFEHAVLIGLGERAGAGPFAELLAGAVLLVDGYEQLGPIDGWLRQAFLPALPADGLVVLAGRDAPAAPWRTDPGWRSVVAVHGLDHFDEAESDELLARAGVAPSVRVHLVRLGRGHPLAMALLADVAVNGTVPDSLAEVPDLVSALLETLLRGAPTEAHMSGLAACATAWLTTEDLLRDVVGADAPAVWAWLERRPFVAGGPHGLWPHDLARDVLDAEFERRSPERYRSLHRVVHDHVVAGLRAATGLDRQLLAQHLTYLHRKSPLTRAFYALRAHGSAAVVPARREEHEQVLSMIEEFQGAATARLAEAWLAEQPDTLSVVRDREGVAAYAYHVMHPTGSAMEQRDPVTRAALEHVARHGPARPGEQVDVARFFAGRREFQRDRYAVLAGSVSSLIEWVSRPLAWSFVIVVDDEYWGPFFEYLAFTRLFELDVGGQAQVAYGNDWRRFPVDTWLDLMNEREHAGVPGRRRSPCCVRRRSTGPASPPPSGPPCRICTGPTGWPRTRSWARRWRRGPVVPAPTSSARPSRTPSPASGTSPRATRSGRCCSARSSAPLQPRRPPPRCSACPSAPTGATWPRRSSSSPTCCGRRRLARSGCRRDRAAIEQQLSTV